MPDDEVASLITINKTNFVVASVLARDSKRNIDFDFSLHQNFPTAKLVWKPAEIYWIHLWFKSFVNWSRVMSDVDLAQCVIHSVLI